MIMNTTSQVFFNSMYQRNPDPWNFASSPYELGRYAHIIEALRGRRYNSAFEPGCSIGVLTEELASICDIVEATDIAQIAVDRARHRCSSLANVHIECGALPDNIPTGKFDLIVFSEIGYYFSEFQLQSLINRLITHMDPCGTFLAAHWLGSSSDHLLSGDQVHQLIMDAERLNLVHSERHENLRLDRWVCQ
jgi:predicted TPR repeat methyltransferase